MTCSRATLDHENEFKNLRFWCPFKFRKKQCMTCSRATVEHENEIKHWRSWRPFKYRKKQCVTCSRATLDHENTNSKIGDRGVLLNIEKTAHDLQ